MKLGERIVALMFLVVGAAAAFRAYGLGLGTTAEHGAGFMPFWASILIVGCSATALVNAFIAKTADSSVIADADEAAIGTGDAMAPGTQLKIWLCVLVLVLYVVALPRLGFLLSTFAVMLALSRFDARTTWPGAFAIAVLGALVFWGIFVLGLGVNFPPASLGF